MKKLIRILVLVHLSIGIFGLNKISAQAKKKFEELIIKDKHVQEALKLYISEYDNEVLNIDSIAVVTLNLYGGKDSLVMYISSEIYLYLLLRDTPSYYLVVDGIPVVVFSGFSSILESEDTYLKDFLALYGYRLTDKPRPLTYSPPIYKVGIFNSGDSITREFVESYPFEDDSSFGNYGQD